MNDQGLAEGSDEPESSGGSFWEWLRRWRGGGDADSGTDTPQSARQVAIGAHERTLLTNVMHLRNLSAADVMIPRVDIVAVDIDTAFDAFVRLLVEEGHSRLPVFKEDLDHIVGMIHAKDVLGVMANGGQSTLNELIRPVLFAAPSTRVLDLLSQMRQQRVHMALVIDEFGGIDGLITIEDLVEQIVGDIEDEHDEIEPAQIIRLSDGSYSADGRASIEQLDEVVGTHLTREAEEEEVDTLGGLLFLLAGRVPHKGEVIHHPSGIRFEVLDADERRVKGLLIRREEPAAAIPHEA